KIKRSSQSVEAVAREAVAHLKSYQVKSEVSLPLPMNNPAIPQPVRRLRAGIVGGGRGAFIGSVHRIAAELDGQAQVVAGAMSSRPEIARESAAAWFLERAYTSYADMASSEAADKKGIDFV